MNTFHLNSKKVFFLVFLITALFLTLVPFQEAQAESEEEQWVPYNFPSINRNLSSNYGFSMMKISPSGTPYIAVELLPSPYKLGVKMYDGNSWVTVGPTDTFSEGGARFSDIAIDSQNIPYVVYNDDTKNYGASVMRFVSDEWEYVGNNPVSSGSVSLTSIAIDNNDVPHVAYVDNFNYAHHIVVKKWDGSNWIDVGSRPVSQTPSGNSNYTGEFPSITFDSNNIPYVAYTDRLNQGKITVKKFENNEWVNVGQAGISDGEGIYAILKFNSAGELYIAFQDNANGRKMTLMKFNGTSWNVVGEKGFTAQLYNVRIWLFFDGNDPVVSFINPSQMYARNTLKLVQAQKQLHVSASNLSLEAGHTSSITLTVTDEQNNTKTSFNGSYPVKIAGYSESPSGAFGGFNGEQLITESTTIDVLFTNGVATADLELYKAAIQELTFQILGSNITTANSVTITTSHGPFTQLQQVRDVVVNGSGNFSPAPQVYLADQYGNVVTNIEWYKLLYAEKIDNGNWTLIGAPNGFVENGYVTFDGIYPLHHDSLNNAQIRFVFDHDGQRITLDSNNFNLPGFMYSPQLQEVYYNGNNVEVHWYGGWDQEGYKIYKGKTVDNLNIEVGTVDGNTTSFIDNTASDGGIYFYAVTSYKNGFETDLSNKMRVYVPSSSEQPPGGGGTEIDIPLEIKIDIKIKVPGAGPNVPPITIPENQLLQIINIPLQIPINLRDYILNSTPQEYNYSYEF